MPSPKRMTYQAADGPRCVRCILPWPDECACPDAPEPETDGGLWRQRIVPAACRSCGETNASLHDDECPYTIQADNERSEGNPNPRSPYVRGADIGPEGCLLVQRLDRDRYLVMVPADPAEHYATQAVLAAAIAWVTGDPSRSDLRLALDLANAVDHYGEVVQP